MKLKNYFVLIIVLLVGTSMTVIPVLIPEKPLELTKIYKIVDENFYNNIDVEISQNIIKTYSMVLILMIEII
tara:strand:+ start:441 stop:656 length:216 start_codon:yes stop_codon:yes gene_type:complete